MREELEVNPRRKSPKGTTMEPNYGHIIECRL